MSANSCMLLGRLPLESHVKAWIIELGHTVQAFPMYGSLDTCMSISSLRRECTNSLILCLLNCDVRLQPFSCTENVYSGLTL